MNKALRKYHRIASAPAAVKSVLTPVRSQYASPLSRTTLRCGSLTMSFDISGRLAATARNALSPVKTVSMSQQYCVNKIQTYVCERRNLDNGISKGGFHGSLNLHRLKGTSKRGIVGIPDEEFVSALVLRLDHLRY